MINCKLSTDTDKRTECRALTKSEYIKMVRAGKCGTSECPFYKPRAEEDWENPQKFDEWRNGHRTHPKGFIRPRVLTGRW